MVGRRNEPSRGHAVGPAGSHEVSLRDELGGSAVEPLRPLVWRRTVPLATDFELRQGDTVFGEMEAAFMAGVDATGECLGRSLEFSLQTGLFRGVRVESRTSSGGEPGPSFRGVVYGWGRIVTAEGEALRWRHAFTGLYDHVLIDSTKKELLRLRPTFLRFGRTETRVVVRPSGWQRPDLAELLLLTWFLRVHAEGSGRRVFRRP